MTSPSSLDPARTGIPDGPVARAGALGPMVPVAAGDEFTVALSGLDGVTARLAPTSSTQQGSTR